MAIFGEMLQTPHLFQPVTLLNKTVNKITHGEVENKENAKRKKKYFSRSTVYKAKRQWKKEAFEYFRRRGLIIKINKIQFILIGSSQ